MAAIANALRGPMFAVLSAAVLAGGRAAAGGPVPGSSPFWATQKRDLVFIGKYSDPAGATALFFLDSATGWTIGPLDLSLPKIDPLWELAAPSVGAPPDIGRGAWGQVELHVILPGAAPAGFSPFAEGGRGTFASFSPLRRPPLTLSQLLSSTRDPLTKALLLPSLPPSDADRVRRELDGLSQAGSVERALLGLRLAGDRVDALRLLALRRPPELRNALSDVRYTLPLALDGLAGLATAGPCDATPELICSWLAGLVTPAKRWVAGQKATATQDVEAGLMGQTVSGIALFEAFRNPESTVQPRNGPFLFAGDIAVPLLKAVAPDFFSHFHAAIAHRYTLPDCTFLSLETGDGKTHVKVKDRLRDNEMEILWGEPRPPTLVPGAAVSLLVEQRDGGDVVVRHQTLDRRSR